MMDFSREYVNTDSNQDERRFTIYIKVNNDEPVKNSDLNIRDYLKFKVNDDYVLQYCKTYLVSENDLIFKLFRSLDDVDYTPVKVLVTCTEKNTDDSVEKRSFSETNSMNESSVEKSSCINQSNTDEAVNIESTDEGQNTSNDASQLTSPGQSSRSKIVTSTIWKHCVKKNEKIECVYCKKQFKDCNNTSNMRKHLKNQHPLYFKEESCDARHEISTVKKGNKRPAQEIKQTLKEKQICLTSNIKEAFKRVESFKSGGSMSDKITNTILFFVCKDLQPLSVVEDEGFLTLLKVLSPLYEIPSRTTLTRKLEARYAVMREAFIKELSEANSYCITCDIWKDCSKETYIGVTVHFQNKHFKLKSAVLGLVPLEERQTANYIKNCLLQLFERFSILIDKITVMISDGEAAIKKACIELVGKEKHLVCFAHILAHLAPDALKTLEALSKIIDKIRSIINKINRSTTETDMLKKLQTNEGKPLNETVILVSDVVTRWNATFEMLERYVHLEQYVYIAMNEVDHPINCLTREELAIVRSGLPIMAPIKEAITDVSGDSYPTASIIIPLVHCMRQTIASLNPDEEIAKQLQSKILEQINSRFKDFEWCHLLSESTILDPRFKKLHFKDYGAVSSAVTKINEKIKIHSLAHKSSVGNKSSIQESSTSSIWTVHDCLLTSREVDSNISNLELDQYFQLPRIHRKDNIFHYWKYTEQSFPMLSKIAMKQLSTLATSVPCERLFSKAKLTKSDTRNKLSGMHLNILIFLSSLDAEMWNLF